MTKKNELLLELTLVSKNILLAQKGYLLILERISQ
jgi:hypothetical protein